MILPALRSRPTPPVLRYAANRQRACATSRQDLQAVEENENFGQPSLRIVIIRGQ